MTKTLRESARKRRGPDELRQPHAGEKCLQQRTNRKTNAGHATKRDARQNNEAQRVKRGAAQREPRSELERPERWARHTSPAEAQRPRAVSPAGKRRGRRHAHLAKRCTGLSSSATDPVRHDRRNNRLGAIHARRKTKKAVRRTAKGWQAPPPPAALLKE